MAALVTGAAGFIGAAVCQQLLTRGDRVVGVDNLNAYYGPALKRARLQRIQAQVAAQAAASNWTFHQLDVTDGAAMASCLPRCVPGA